MEAVPRARALDERDTLDRLAVGGPQEVPSGRAVVGGHPLEHDVGDDVSTVAEGEVRDRCGIVGFPARGDDHGAHRQMQCLRLLVKVDRLVRAYVDATMTLVEKTG